MKLTKAQRKWLTLLDRVGSVSPSHGAATLATKRACEERGWAETKRSVAFNVIVTRITDLGRRSLSQNRGDGRVNIALFDNVCSIIFFFVVLPWVLSQGDRK